MSALPPPTAGTIIGGFRRTLATLALTALGAAGAAHAACPAVPADCLYVSPTQAAQGTITMDLFDPARSHAVPVRVRYPIGTTDNAPVVFWHHGGGTNPLQPASTYPFGSIRRAQSLAAAGYIVIQIGRVPRVNLTAADLAFCAASAVPDCGSYIGWHRDGALNTAYVAAQLPGLLVGQMPGFTGIVDASRIAIGGWSGGSSVALNHAGADKRVQPAVPVPGTLAYVLDAPVGTVESGYNSSFDKDAFHALGAIPALFTTGRGDEQPPPDDQPAEARTAAWLGASAGGKLLSWDTLDEVGHAQMDLNECLTPVQQQHCRWMQSLAVAFLDAKVRALPNAVRWLASPAYVTLTGGVIELHRR